MRFTGMEPLSEGFPHTELSSGEYRFDIHNAADLVRMDLDFARCQFELEWRVENLLASAYYGPFRRGVVILRVAGLTEFFGSAHVVIDPTGECGVDFIEYVAGSGISGALRFVFTSAGEISVSGSDCGLHIVSLE